MVTSLVAVPFHGAELLAAQRPDGIWVPIKRVCKALGLQHADQLAKLKSKGWATVGIIPTVAADGRKRRVACVDLDSLPMWLATIDRTRVRRELRALLLRFQREARQVLRDHFVARPKGTLAEQRLELFLAERASPHKVTFKSKLTKELCRLYGQAYGGGRQPRFLAMVYRRLYEAAYGRAVAKGLKRINPEPKRGSNHHQFFRHHELLEENLTVVYTIAITSIDRDDFWSRIGWHFQRTPLQLGF